MGADLEGCKLARPESAVAASFLGYPTLLASCQTVELRQGYRQAAFESGQGRSHWNPRKPAMFQPGVLIMTER